MTARWLMRNGYMTYLSCVVESRKKKKKIELKDIHVVREFPDVFSKELSGLLKKKDWGFYCTYSATTI